MIARLLLAALLHPTRTSAALCLLFAASVAAIVWAHRIDRDEDQ